ncbi:MAG: ATP-binding cassette domain-containing protein [Lactococcus cremoris]
MAFQKEVTKETEKKVLLWIIKKNIELITEKLAIFLVKKLKCLRRTKMFYYVKNFKMQNTLLFVFIVLWALLNVISSLTLTWLLNALIGGKWNTFIFWALMNILCWAGYSFLQAVKDTFKERIMQNQINKIREEILNNLIQKPYYKVKENSKEDYNSWLINDMTLIHDNGFSQFYGAVESVVTVLLNAFAIIYFHWLLLIVSVIMTAFVYFAPQFFEKRISKATNDVSEFSNRALGKTTDFFNGFDIFYHNNQGGYLKKQILGSFNNLINPKVRLAKLSATANSVSMMASIIAQSAMFLVTGYLIMKGEVTTGVIFSIANLTSCLFNYTRGAAYNIVTLRGTFKLMDKYQQLKDDDDVEIDEAVKFKINKFNSSIETKNLVIKFENNQIIRFPNIKINKGEKIAIVGDSGTGKSTLVQLLMGDSKSYEGDILIDRLNYRRINIQSLQNVISLINQSPYVFRESLLDNLKIGREVPAELFEKTMKKSIAEEFTRNRLDMIFDDNLSGGQKARLSIARELLGNKDILIMDESTANLDKNTAIKIEQNILKDSNATVIIITHHLYDESKMLLDQIIQL